MHSIMDPPVGTFAGSIVEPTDLPTEDILPPILPPTEDILPAWDNIPVRFTVGMVPYGVLGNGIGSAKAAARRVDVHTVKAMLT